MTSNFSVLSSVKARECINCKLTTLYDDFQETTEQRVQKESPYLLFYERVGMDYKKFQPDVKDRTPESSNDEDEIDNEFKKACVLQ